MDRLKVLCFAGTYGLALLAELARLVVRSPVRWYLTVGLTALGWLVQTAFLANLALKEPMILPVTTAFESLMVLSWIVALIGLYLMVHSPRPVAVGLFVLPLVLGLVVAAGWFAPRESDWLDWGGTDRLLGHGARDLPAGRGGLHLRGVRRRADVPGPDAAAQAQAPGPVRAVAAEPRAVRAGQPGGDHARLPPADVRPADRRGPEREGPRHWRPATGSTLGWTDPKVVSALGMWLVFAVLLARPVPAGDAGPERDGADDRGLRVPGLHLGGRRGAPACPRPTAPPGRPGRVAVRLLALGVDHRSAPAAVREALAFDGPKCAQGLERSAAGLPRQRVRDPLDLQPGRGLRRRQPPDASPRPTP